MKILVTGGSGFIGKILISYLSKNGYEVLNVDKVSSYIENIYEINEDLKLIDITNKQFRDIDICIHLASTVGGIIFNNKKKLKDDNRLINESVVKICKKNNIKRLIFISSINVFENTELITDSYFYNINKPSSSYAISKLESEEYLLNNFNKILIIRPTNVFGLTQIRTSNKIGESHVIPELMQKIKESKQDIYVLGDGTQKRNFLHVNDLCKFIIANITFNKSDNYNVRSNITITISDLVKILLKIMNKEYLNIKYDKSFMKYEKIKIYNFKTRIKDIEINSIEEGLQL